MSQVFFDLATLAIAVSRKQCLSLIDYRFSDNDLYDRSKLAWLVYNLDHWRENFIYQSWIIKE